ncbi:post-transcriptional regulator [Gorillibacterium sp. sgz5001074]|uniref:post-transcriptional regulator n=1 Tax=Gorillibacterium sp. sgz5001074 TaxID=3446695 RepID=UPI003F677CEF
MEERQIEGPDERELNALIESLCNSKADEFRMLGYEHVTGPEIWDCVNDKYHKTGIPALHQVVNDILSLKATQFMNWMTLRVYRGDPLL